MAFEEMSFDFRALVGIAAIALALALLVWLYFLRKVGKLAQEAGGLRRQVLLLQVEEREFRENDHRKVVEEREKLKNRNVELEDEAVQLKKGGTHA